MNINSWTGVGRLAADVDHTPQQGDPADGGVSARTTGRLIVNRPRRKTQAADGKPQYDVISFVAWGRHAVNLAEHTSKGKEIGVEGPIRTNSKQRADKGWDNYFEVQVEKVHFGRDSTTAKVMKALQAGGEVPAGDDGVQAAINKMMANNPGLEARLQQVQQGITPATKLQAEEVVLDDVETFVPDEPFKS